MSGLPVLTAQEMIQAETDLFKSGTIHAETLMNSAGQGVARALISEFGMVGNKSNPLNLGIVCGWGNNGGDGFVVAQILASLPQFRITIFDVCPQRSKSELAQRMSAAIPPGVRRVKVTEQKILKSLFVGIDVIVDALFGIGLSRPLAPLETALIERINQAGLSSTPIVSVDVPSGLDATTGNPWGAIVMADLTITVGAFKIGQWVGVGLEACGRICLERAGFPSGNLSAAAQSFLGYGLAQVESLLPKRGRNSHKYSNGKILIIAGSEGMWGAALLAATSALRAGAGHVTLASFSPSMKIVQTLPEVLSLDLSSTEVDFSKYDACLIGPGLKDDSELEVLLNRMRNERVSKVVLDATGLGVFARMKKDFDFLQATATWILTPHEGEARKLLKDVAGGLKADRWQLYHGLSRDFGSVFILKGPKSWIFSGKKKPVAVSFTGNDALAKAGAGDVLAGIVVTFYSQMNSAHDAAVLGCVVHGAAADLWASSHGRRSLLVSELPGLVGDVLSTFEGDSAL